MKHIESHHVDEFEVGTLFKTCIGIIHDESSRMSFLGVRKAKGTLSESGEEEFEDELILISVPWERPQSNFQTETICAVDTTTSDGSKSLISKTHYEVRRKNK